MGTNINLDDELMARAGQYSKARTKRALVHEALATALECKTTAYDAVFIALSRSRDLPLIMKGEEMRLSTRRHHTGLGASGIAAALCAAAVLVAGCRTLPVRGPFVQNLTHDGVTFMGRPTDALLGEAIRVEVRPDGGAPVRAEGRYDRARDTFRIRVEGLPANTVCRYSLRIGVEEVGPFHFVTAPVPGDLDRPFRFAAYGDSRSQPAVHKKIADAILSQGPRFALTTGDLVGNGDIGPAWGPEFFDPARNLAAHVDLLPAAGNHEGTATNLLRWFDIPGLCFKRDYGSVRVITLASYRPCEPGTEQYDWLVRTLSEPWDGWRVVQMHAPPHGIGRPMIFPWIQNVSTLLAQHGVDLVFCGHDHYYMRSKPIAFEKDQRGFVQIVTGGGGAPLYGFSTNQPQTAVAVSRHHYLILDVTRERISARTISIEGEEIDAFTIKKNGPQPDRILSPLKPGEPWQAP